MASRQNKVKINASVARKTNEEYDKLGNATDSEGRPVYGGKSNVIETALNFYLGSLEKEKEIKIKELERELKRANDELSYVKAGYDEKIRLLEAEQKKNKDLLFRLLIKHPELANEIKEVQNIDVPENKGYTRRVVID